LQGVDGNQVMAGDVLCHPDFPVAAAKNLELKVLLLEGASPILLEFHIHHSNYKSSPRHHDSSHGEALLLLQLSDNISVRATNATNTCHQSSCYHQYEGES